MVVAGYLIPVVVATIVLLELAPGAFRPPAREFALCVLLALHPTLINRHVMINSDNPIYNSFFI
jgi:hypothetical protein